MLPNDHSLNHRLQSYRHLKCGAAWNSIGTHLFLEFGHITHHTNRAGINIPRGELTISLHADAWRLFDTKSELLNSDSISPHSLEIAFETYLRGQEVPRCIVSDIDLVSLIFLDGLVLSSEGFDDPMLSDDIEAELVFSLPNGEILNFGAGAGMY